MGTRIRYSAALKRAVLELSKLSAHDVVAHIQEQPRFKKEARTLTAASVYSIWYRARETTVKTTEPPPTATTEKSSGPVSAECLITHCGEYTTLTVSVPTAYVSEVLCRLGY